MVSKYQLCLALFWASFTNTAQEIAPKPKKHQLAVASGLKENL